MIHALFLPFNLYKSHYSCTLFPKNAANKPIKNFMEVFENVLDSYIISKIETEFFGNGIFLESGAVALSLSILTLSQILTKSIYSSVY